MSNGGFALHSVVSIPGRALRFVVDRAIGHLTRPTRLFSPSEVTDLKSLKRRLRKGDVLLICGNTRISYVVKVLTRSPWSHVVLYVGDRRDLLTEEEKNEWTARYGEASLQHLVIDADPVRRVHLRPLDEYVGVLLRHCRAEALSDEDKQRVVETALEQLGREYDIRHIVRLLFFFAFPWEFLPESLRRFVTDFTLSEDDRICSRVVAEAFHDVGYPIRPLEIIEERSALESRALGFAFGVRRRGRSARKLLFGGRLRSAVNRLTDGRYTEIHFRGARHITPADYDLSRFFSIIKDERDLGIRYRDARTLRTLGERLPWK